MGKVKLYYNTRMPWPGAEKDVWMAASSGLLSLNYVSSLIFVCERENASHNELDLSGCQENNARKFFIWPMIIHKAKGSCESFLALCLPAVSGY